MTNKSETSEQLEFYAKQQPLLNYLMIVLGWFTVTVEVFLRRDFGERYFTRTKFVMGLFVLLMFNFFGALGNLMPSTRPLIFDPERGLVPPEPEAPSFSLGISAIYLVLLLYLVLGSYHTLRIWWRNGTARPLHSYDHGLTWLEPIGAVALVVPNAIIGLFVRLYALTLPVNERAWISSALPFLRDVRSFAERFLEPLLLFLLGILFAVLEVSMVPKWLFVSSFAITLFTTIRHEVQRNQFLDLRDSLIESGQMRDAMSGDTESLRVPYGTKKALFEAARQAEKSLAGMDALRENNPTIAGAMEALNPKLKGMTARNSSAAASPPEPPPVTTGDASAAPPEAQAEPSKDGGLSVEEALAALKGNKPKT